jgi:hypothetical protein
MYSSNNPSKKSKGFPDPLAHADEKAMQEYGLQYAKAIENQWGSGTDTYSSLKTKKETFARSRKYANGTQDTTPYKKL